MVDRSGTGMGEENGVMTSAVETLGQTQGLPIMALGSLSHGLPAIHPLSLVRKDALPPFRLFRLVVTPGV